LAAVHDALATACGFVNGVFVTKLRIPAFITTLGMQYVYRAAAFIYTGHTPVYIQDPFWLYVGSGTDLGIPFPILLMVVCFAAALYVLRKTPFGRSVIAVGTNRRAAMLSGIGVDFVKNTVFTLVGFFVGIATVVNASYLGSVNAGMTGQGYEFQVITVVVLGGTALIVTNLRQMRSAWRHHHSRLSGGTCFCMSSGSRDVPKPIPPELRRLNRPSLFVDKAQS
jgi:ribose/xylose/arabinose/galactoside ABC-type transport system permease subunit